MTKVSIFGKGEAPEPKKKKIEFVNLLSEDGPNETNSKPQNYDNVVLMQLNYSLAFDLMWAYNSKPNDGVLFLGHWNDGVV